MQVQGIVQRILSTRIADATAKVLRVGSYGEVHNNQAMIAPDTQAMEGTRFVSLPTPAAGGAGTALGIQTSFSETAHVPVLITNGDANLYMIMDYIRMRITAVGANTTSAEVAVALDPANRYSSGGTSQTIYNCSPAAAAPASIGTMRIGDVTATAASAGRKWIGHQLIRKAAANMFIADDVYTLFFGNFGVNVPQNIAQVIATTAVQASFLFAPAVIPPGGSLLMHLANVGNSATPPSMEFEASWTEK